MARNDEWYRSADWDESAQAEFRLRLARARPWGRQQYRRIKALALLETDEQRLQDAGRKLLEENLASDETVDHERVLDLTILARSDRARGDLHAAEIRLRQAFDVPTRSGRSPEDEIELAEILMIKATPSALAEAREWLDRRSSEPPLFVRSRFRLTTAYANLSLLTGDQRSASLHAQAALELARETESGLQNHPSFGLVETDQDTMRWLRSVALGQGLDAGDVGEADKTGLNEA